ncbi:glycosyltransferase family 4 protein [Allorhodopirellula heiligendammensis]|uniref:Glycogen synthase n=1 Tax=Allorhodopirellula heiligendammensis TaxID=2714739 RepID=A0A5C6C0L5_9BACT|nr:glycosyltransferase family 4 protein [Allorhodopirellula heiligendammensis]TWU18080.1 Glycogen synthase [Allorhodopirellula heiligendammensis]
MAKDRVLLIAEACNPEWFSVPLVGWAHASALRELADYDVTVATQIRNREAILRAGWVEGEDFVSIDSERVAAPAYKVATLLRGGANKGWTTVTAVQSLTYNYFERLIWSKYKQELRSGRYQLVHRLTPLSPTSPSYLASKLHSIDVPFIIGPLNGGVPWPTQFSGVRRKEKEWLSYIRSMHTLMPGYHRTRRSARALIIGSKDTWHQMPEAYQSKCVYIPENGIDLARFSKTRTRQATLPLELVFVGRLVPYKGADMLIEAAQNLIRNGQARVTIIGSGPEYETLQQLSLKLGCAEGVRLLGSIEHQAVQDHLIQADLMVFPSIREFGGAVALEAMAVGLVPMVVRYGGIGELVSDETGFLIEMGSRDEIVASLRQNLEHVVADPSLIEQKAVAAKDRVQHWFTWDAKARQVSQVYDWVLGRLNQKPHWGMPFGNNQDHAKASRGGDHD